MNISGQPVSTKHGPSTASTSLGNVTECWLSRSTLSIWGERYVCRKWLSHIRLGAFVSC